MTCSLIHIMEDPDRDAYRDPDLKDLMGQMPRFYCARKQPLEPLLPSQSVKCLRVSAPCWKPRQDDLGTGTAGASVEDDSPYTF